MLRALKDLWEARKGFRWSLYFVNQGRLRYALHENAVIVLLGYVISQVERGRLISNDWELFINFNRNHKSIQLTEASFIRSVAGDDDNSEMTISPELIAWIADIDRGWMVPGGKPVFVDAKTRKEIPLGDSYEAVFRTANQRRADIEKMFAGADSQAVSLESVIQEVFPRS